MNPRDSVMYRSFLTCDDPKGVVECGTIKRVKSSDQKMEDKTKSRRTAKNSYTCLPNKADKQEMAPKGKGSSEKSHDQSCLQLMEVSRGAERLNITIDAWSRGLRHDRGTENIAKDLLKGALDLQESLVMLRKLQDARLKSKQSEKAERVRIDAKLIDTTHSDKCSDRSYPVGFQRPRPSADASSRNSTEEPKEVIRNSLIRQNLLPCTSTEGLDSTSEIQSTSSNQSSLTYNDKLSDSSFSSTASKKEKGPNLFVKLMGLEQFPPRPFPASVKKQLEGEKILNQKRTTFEIDMPKVRKTNSMVHKVDPARKKNLREILGTMHFKGMLKKSSVKEPKLQIHHFDDPRSKQYDALPPIVLIKPKCRESVEAHSSVPSEQIYQRKLNSEVVPYKIIKHEERYKKMDEKTEHEDVLKKISREKEPKELKVIKLKHAEKAPNKVKLNCDVSHQVQVSETIDQKATVKIITRKLPDKEIFKPRIVTRSQDQGEITPAKKEVSKPRIVARSQDEETTSTKLMKPQIGSRIHKNDISCQQSTATNTIAKIRTQKLSMEKRKNQVKKQRPVAEPKADKPAVERLGHEEEENMIADPGEDNCTELRTITTVADELPMEHVAEASAYKIGEEDHKQSQTSLGDVTLLKAAHEDDAIPAEEAHDGINCSKRNSRGGKQGGELNYLLLTSESFISHAEELLNLHVDSTMILHKYDPNGVENLRLYLDCANELTERKSQKESQIVQPLLLTCAVNSRLNMTLERLVEEISNAIENLKMYSKISGEKPSVNHIFAITERDIQCNGLINGIWEWGWRHGFSADEAEQVVNEVENLVLSGLIEEVIT